jgi:hypothetical protein
MAVQGMALAIAARQKWPDVKLVEAHPKALYYATSNLKYRWPGEMSRWLFQQIKSANETMVATEHEWDALISAWAALQGASGYWTNDLRQLSQSAIEPVSDVAYWWPE